MRTVLICVLVVLASVACTKPNPNTCCVTDAQCAALGANELRPCEAGQACAADYTCVAAECSTSSQCSTGTPICQNGLCVDNCSIDDDCADVSGRPFCATDGVCVGCIDAGQCPATAGTCDMEDRTCRGCERDDECASGVCIEMDAVCAAEADIIHVRMFGVDAGTCTAAAPCQTLGYAVQQVMGTRNVIRVMGGMMAAEPTVSTYATNVILDGTGTLAPKPITGPWLSVGINSVVTIEGITVAGRTTPMIRRSRSRARCG